MISPALFPNQVLGLALPKEKAVKKIVQTKCWQFASQYTKQPSAIEVLITFSPRFPALP